MEHSCAAATFRCKARALVKLKTQLSRYPNNHTPLRSLLKPTGYEHTVFTCTMYVPFGWIHRLKCNQYKLNPRNTQILVVSRIGWMQIHLEGRMSQQLLSFMSLLSSGTRCASWWVGSWMLLLCDRFKAACCCPPVACLASDSSLCGVILNHPEHIRVNW